MVWIFLIYLRMFVYLCFFMNWRDILFYDVEYDDVEYDDVEF